MRLREADVVAAVVNHLNFLGYRSATEYPILGRIADVFAVEESCASIAVECKERDWRRGLHQATRYRAAADEVYLAIPLSVVTSKVTEAAATMEIGVLAVDREGVSVVVPSTSSPIGVLRERTVAAFDARLPID